MAVSDIALFSALKTRMNWLQQRQAVLAENVANANTPNFRARDLSLPEAGSVARAVGGGAVGPTKTHIAHLGLDHDGAGRARATDTQTFEVRPSGNSVVLEEEMMKVSETQMDYQLATSLYSRGIGILKTALGRR